MLHTYRAVSHALEQAGGIGNENHYRRAMNNLAVTLHSMGKLDEAIEYYIKCLGNQVMQLYSRQAGTQQTCRDSMFSLHPNRSLVFVLSVCPYCDRHGGMMGVTYMSVIWAIYYGIQEDCEKLLIYLRGT